MKRLLLIILFFLAVPWAKGTHLIGGSMSYQYLGANSRGNFNYKVTLIIYRDCLQGEVNFDDDIKIGVYHNNTQRSKHRTVTIKLISKKLVSPPGNTDCDFKPNVCIEEGFYEGIIEVEPSTLGYHLTFVRCCRNVQNNLVTGGSGRPEQGQTYYCFIPPTNIRNSSPVFKGVPSPYMCANDTTSFLNTALDPDGDSLVYYFVRPFQGGDLSPSGIEPTPPPYLSLPIKPVTYNVNFDELDPFGPTGYSKIDRFNGLTDYFTRITGNFVVAIEVAEYRNGQLLSVVRLDLQIIFINCPPNKKPTITSDKGRNFSIEAGSKLCFNIISTDADNDFLELTPVGDIFTGLNGWKGPKATLSAKNGQGRITSEFCWQTSCDQASPTPYTFAVKVEDDGCPGKFNAVNFKITVNPFVSNINITGPVSVCQNTIATYTINNMAKNTKLEWDVENGVILWEQGTNTMDYMWDGLGKGKVRVREVSEYGCFGDWVELEVQINPSPPTPIISGKDTVCLSSAGVVYGITNFTAGLTTKWTINTGVMAANNNNLISVNWNTLGDQIIKVVTTNTNGCVSDTGFIKVNVRKPNPLILGPKSICPNAKNIEYNVQKTASSKYTWSVLGGAVSGANDQSKVLINWGNQGNGILTVVETDRFGCKSDPLDYIVKKSYILDPEYPIGRTSVCDYEQNVPYFVYNANGTSYSWTITGGSLVSPSITSKVSVNWGGAGNGTVEVSRTAYDSVNMRQCIGAPSQILVKINPTPDQNIIEGDFELCQLPDSLSYTLNGFAGSKYFWEVNGSSQNISGQGSKTIKIAWNTPGTFNIKVREMSKDSCWGNMIDSNVIVHPKPTAAAISGPAIVCDPNYTNMSYNINGFVNSSYTWKVNNGVITSGLGTDKVVIDWTGSEPAWIHVVETSEFGCVGDSVLQDIVMDKLNLEMLVVSVGLPDDKIEVTWTSGASKGVPRQYEIERRNTGDLVWGNILTLNNFTTYIDKPLNTDLHSFDYQIKAKDLCGVEKVTIPHTNVFLKGSKSEDIYTVDLEFYNYVGWKNGVEKYVLYRYTSSSGIYEPYDSFTDPSEVYYQNGLEAYRQCYRVKSYERGGNEQVSWSNEVCFNFSPVIYIPNAFSPNNDGINDKFIIKSGALKTYNLQIFNRWGEKLWETNNFEEHWNGTSRGTDVQLGVYVYKVVVTDFKDKEFYLNGTVHVIR